MPEVRQRRRLELVDTDELDVRVRLGGGRGGLFGNSSDPKVQAAVEKCRSLLPQPPQGFGQRGTRPGTTTAARATTTAKKASPAKAPTKAPTTKAPVKKPSAKRAAPSKAPAKKTAAAAKKAR